MNAEKIQYLAVTAVILFFFMAAIARQPVVEALGNIAPEWQRRMHYKGRHWR